MRLRKLTFEYLASHFQDQNGEIARKILKISAVHNMSEKCLQSTSVLLNELLPDSNVPKTSRALRNHSGEH